MIRKRQPPSQMTPIRGTMLDQILGLPGESPSDTLFVVDAGGPAIDLAAVPAEDAHVFEYRAGTAERCVASEGAQTRMLDTFRWRMSFVDAPPRTLLSQGRLLSTLGGLAGVSDDAVSIVLSVATWDAALDFLRDHGPIGGARGIAILADMPVSQAPCAAFEDLFDGATATLVDCDRAHRVVGGAGASGRGRPEAVGVRFSDVACEAGRITATLTCAADLPEGVSVVARHGDDPVAIARPRPLDQTGRRFSVELELPRSLQFDISVPAVTLQLGAPELRGPQVSATLPSRRFINAEELLEADFNTTVAAGGRRPLGIVLYSDTRTESALLVLEGLKRQGALPLVEIWMDGDQGKPGVKGKLEQAEARFAAFGVATIRRHRGTLGSGKLMLHSLFHMCTAYDRFVVLEDDCFPTNNAIAHFRAALDRHADSPEVLTVYGSHFAMPCETETCPRFQGSGWATWSDRLLPVLHELAYLYSLPEPTYLDWVDSVLTPEIEAAVDCTAPHRATDTLRRFFAWDDALCLLAALHGQVHAPTATRCIYNFGAEADSTDVGTIDRYRKPPFNMILKDEVWEHFDEPAPA